MRRLAARSGARRIDARSARSLLTELRAQGSRVVLRDALNVIDLAVHRLNPKQRAHLNVAVESRQRGVLGKIAAGLVERYQ